MIQKSKMFFLNILGFLPLAAIILVQCRPDINVEHESVKSSVDTDTLNVTSFNIERTNSPLLADWKSFEINDEVVVLPPDWVHKENIDSFVLVSSKYKDKNERFIFNRYRKSSEAFNSDKFAQQVINKSFTDFSVERSDTLKKIELAHGSFYERTTALTKRGIGYQGYCMVYEGDSLIYEYNIALAQIRIDSYKGSFIKDIVGNLQINHQYIISNENKVKNIIFIKK